MMLHHRVLAIEAAVAAAAAAVAVVAAFLGTAGNGRNVIQGAPRGRLISGVTHVEEEEGVACQRGLSVDPSIDDTAQLLLFPLPSAPLRRHPIIRLRGSKNHNALLLGEWLENLGLSAQQPPVEEKG